MVDRAALLIAAWGLDPQHEIVLFLSGSSERVPAPPDDPSEVAARARLERDDMQGQLEDVERTLAKVLKIKRLPKTARALLEELLEETNELLKEINDDA